MKMSSVSFLAEILLRDHDLFAWDSVELHCSASPVRPLSRQAGTRGVPCSQWSPRASQHASDLNFSTVCLWSAWMNVSLLFLCLPHREERWRREGTLSVPSSQQAHRTHLPTGPLRPQSHGWKPGHYDSPGVRSVQIALSLGRIREWSCGNGYCS